MNNIKLTPTPISPPPNGAGITKADPGPTVVSERVRTIAPLTQYNPESGLVEPDPESPWGGQAKPLEEPAPKPADPAAPSRREAWKAEQDKIKAERAQKSAKALEERQPLARDFLKKGDLAGAAKALGMTPTEFREYAQNVLLTMPTPDKELAPEQKREADEQKFRKDQEDFRKEQETFRYQTIADGYIRDKIRPILLDKEKYEFISQQEPSKIEAFIYRFMNEHYAKTKEELNPADVADTIEADLEKTFLASIERHKGLKKVAKVLGAPKPSAEVPQLSTETAEEEPEKPAARPKPAERPAPVVKQATIRTEAPGTKVPFALMSREERLALMRDEEQNP